MGCSFKLAQLRGLWACLYLYFTCISICIVLCNGSRVIALQCSESVTSSGRWIPRRFIARKPYPGSSSWELFLYFYFDLYLYFYFYFYICIGKPYPGASSWELFLFQFPSHLTPLFGLIHPMKNTLTLHLWNCFMPKKEEEEKLNNIFGSFSCNSSKFGLTTGMWQTGRHQPMFNQWLEDWGWTMKYLSPTNPNKNIIKYEIKYRYKCNTNTIGRGMRLNNYRHSKQASFAMTLSRLWTAHAFDSSSKYKYNHMNQIQIQIYACVVYTQWKKYDKLWLCMFIGSWFLGGLLWRWTQNKYDYSPVHFYEMTLSWVRNYSWPPSSISSLACKDWF